jgi:hypothetical protein
MSEGPSMSDPSDREASECRETGTGLDPTPVARKRTAVHVFVSSLLGDVEAPGAVE